MVTKTNDLPLPIDEAEMNQRGVYEKYLDAQEQWMRAIVGSVLAHKGMIPIMSRQGADERVDDARRRLMNVIFTGDY